MPTPKPRSERFDRYTDRSGRVLGVRPHWQKVRGYDALTTHDPECTPAGYAAVEPLLAWARSSSGAWIRRVRFAAETGQRARAGTDDAPPPGPRGSMDRDSSVARCSDRVASVNDYQVTAVCLEHGWELYVDGVGVT